MIRISFNTQHDALDPLYPGAWRSEAAAILRQIADKIDAGSPMPIQLTDQNGNHIGQAREISYRPEKLRA